MSMPTDALRVSKEGIFKIKSFCLSNSVPVYLYTCTFMKVIHWCHLYLKKILCFATENSLLSSKKVNKSKALKLLILKAVHYKHKFIWPLLILILCCAKDLPPFLLYIRVLLRSPLYIVQIISLRVQFSNIHSQHLTRAQFVICFIAIFKLKLGRKLPS